MITEQEFDSINVGDTVCLYPDDKSLCFLNKMCDLMNTTSLVVDILPALKRRGFPLWRLMS